MAEITLKGNPIHTSGNLPAVGSDAPAFTLTDNGLAPKTLADYAGKTVVLNIFPSVDTPVCAASSRRFNSEISGKEGAAVLCISADLPFAQKRFCGAEGLDNVATLSSFRNPEFAESYGCRIEDGPLAGLLARAVVVVAGDGKVKHAELVPEIAQEPNYEAALAAL